MHSVRAVIPQGESSTRLGRAIAKASKLVACFEGGASEGGASEGGASEGGASEGVMRFFGLDTFKV